MNLFKEQEIWDNKLGEIMSLGQDIFRDDLYGNYLDEDTKVKTKRRIAELSRELFK